MKDTTLSDAARAMGKKGGSKGGLKSASNLTSEQRIKRASKAGKARWAKERQKKVLTKAKTA